MIGQRNLQSRIALLIESGNFPRFTILVGKCGSGRKTFVRENIIKNLTDGLYEECGIKIDDIRNLIRDAYKIHSAAVYFIPDADNMSPAAKNALLKIVEEPPNNAFFIMTLEDENNTLDTIKSRATVFHMDNYKVREISEYYEILSNDSKYVDYIKVLCETPGDVQKCLSMCDGNIQTFYDYVQLVVDNIDNVSVANAFKIPSKVALKESDEGYDLRLFLRAVAIATFCRAKQSETEDELRKYCTWYSITGRYLQKLRITGVNRQMLMDNWILSIRGE